MNANSCWSQQQQSLGRNFSLRTESTVPRSVVSLRLSLLFSYRFSALSIGSLSELQPQHCTSQVCKTVRSGWHRDVSSHKVDCTIHTPNCCRPRCECPVTSAAVVQHTEGGSSKQHSPPAPATFRSLTRSLVQQRVHGICFLEAAHCLVVGALNHFGCMRLEISCCHQSGDSAGMRAPRNSTSSEMPGIAATHSKS